MVSLIQRLSFIIKLDRIIDDKTASKCMVQIGSRTNIYHKIEQNYKHNNIKSKCIVQISSLGPTFIIKLDRALSCLENHFWFCYNPKFFCFEISMEILFVSNV